MEIVDENYKKYKSNSKSDINIEKQSENEVQKYLTNDNIDKQPYSETIFQSQKTKIINKLNTLRNKHKQKIKT